MLKKSLLVAMLLIIIGCTPSRDFRYGIANINAINQKFNTTTESSPPDLGQINLMINELKEAKKISLDKGQEPFYYAVNYRILNLEAEQFYIESQKYGESGTTKYGFACKPRPLIIESAGLRNKSANKGFEAVTLLREFVGKYPEESKSIGLTSKTALFLNATFYQIFSDANQDIKTIDYFCPENVTLELYREEFRKETDFSEDFINSLNYKKASELWMQNNGLN